MLNLQLNKAKKRKIKFDVLEVNRIFGKFMCSRQKCIKVVYSYAD